jgi:hypothetical protein
METVVPFNEMDLARAQRGVDPERSEGVRNIMLWLLDVTNGVIYISFKNLFPTLKKRLKTQISHP